MTGGVALRGDVSMNLTRGLVRTWIVLTVLYVLAQLFHNGAPDVHLPFWWTALCFVAPPVGLAVLLAALGWIIAGFRQRPSN